MRNILFSILIFLAFSPTLMGDEASYEHQDHILEVAATSMDEAISLVEADGVSLYDFGMSILIRKPEKALYWYSTLSNKFPEKLEYHFGVDWVYWVKDELLEAQKQAVYVLSIKSDDELFQARAHYLLGIIYLQTKSLDHAKKELDLSSNMFEKLNLNGGRLNCGLAYADLLYLNGELDQATEMVKKCETINAKRKDPPSGIPRINYRKASISFRQGNIPQALEEFKLAAKAEMETDPTLKIIARSCISICLSRLGDYRGATVYAKEVDNLVKDTGRKGLEHYYNLIAWKLIFKCQGDDSNHLDSEILKWAEDNGNNAELLNMFEVIKNVDCQDHGGIKETPKPILPFALGVSVLLILAGLIGAFVKKKPKPV